MLCHFALVSVLCVLVCSDTVPRQTQFCVPATVPFILFSIFHSYLHVSIQGWLAGKVDVLSVATPGGLKSYLKCIGFP